ncbi:MAG: hypothetical protein DRI26_05005 [Chloroflexi bacterium]|nr:MAG: hypothetical protein DRI26_05005 [Chloroflexota bacterium]
MEQALSDVKVLDLTWYIAGPYCTKMLADYGADVVKVERPPEGDPARSIGPFLGDEPHPEKSGLFLHLNTNKRGITLNLKTDAGKSIFKELVKNVDILVENFSPGVMDRLGFSYEELEKINPKLVVTSISNFGRTGPYRDFRATEIVEFAMGGEMYSTGSPELTPLKLGGNVVQYQAGTIAAVSTMGALLWSRQQGVGQHIDISIMETQAGGADRRNIYLLGYAYGGVVTQRWPSGGAAAVRSLLPRGIYPCQDGFVMFLGLPQWWPRFLKLLGLEGEPRFQNFIDTTHEDEFRAIWFSWLVDHTKEEIFKLCLENRIAGAPLNTVEEVVNDRHLEYRGFFVEIEHPVVGRVKYPGAPFKMMESPWQAKRPAPLLGQHNEEVYGQLGYTQKDLARLKEEGVI